MGEVIAVISGKGGTGKTTVCAAVASCLAAEGKRVMCIDTDLGLRNLDIALGMSDLPMITFTDVIQGTYELSAATLHPQLENLRLLTAPVRENEELVSPEGFNKLIEMIREEYDYCFIDSPAGLGSGFRLATAQADRYLVISTPDPASLRDAGYTADLLILDGKEDLHLIVNRVQPKLCARMDMTIDDIMDGVGLPLLGIVPEDRDVVLAAAEGSALIFATDGGAAEACLRIAWRLQGKSTPLMKL